MLTRISKIPILSNFCVFNFPSLDLSENRPAQNPMVYLIMFSIIWWRQCEVNPQFSDKAVSHFWWYIYIYIYTYDIYIYIDVYYRIYIKIYIYTYTYIWIYRCLHTLIPLYIRILFYIPSYTHKMIRVGESRSIPHFSWFSPINPYGEVP